MKIQSFCIASLLLALLIFACQGAKPAAVEKIDGNTTTLLPLRLHEFTGLRDGYILRGTITFVRNKISAPAIETITPDSLILRIVVEPGVPTRFVSGRFHLRNGKELLEGTVTSSDLIFHGGQGGLPSLGGTFLFRTDWGEAYKVYIPPTEVARK
jgi:hypothetical protein